MSSAKPTKKRTAPDSSYAHGPLRVYFNSGRADIDGRLTERLVSFIEAAKSSLDVAIYDLREPEVLKALRTASKRLGKHLRIAYDASGERPTNANADPKPRGNREKITKEGLAGFAKPVYETGRHLMHDKFVIRDRRAVWTGSANFTKGGLGLRDSKHPRGLQDNNCIEAQSVALAKVYQTAFDDLWNRGIALAPPGPPKGVRIGDAAVSVYVAPGAGESVDALCVRLLEKAKKVRLMAFVITDPDILEALARFKPRRTDIKGIVDPAALETVKKIKTLNPRVLWWTSDPRIRIARSQRFSPTGENDFQHNKVLILDDQCVICGSYNLSENAEANDENLLLIESRDVAAAYSAYFDAVYATGRVRTKARAETSLARSRARSPSPLTQ